MAHAIRNTVPVADDRGNAGPAWSRSGFARPGGDVER